MGVVGLNLFEWIEVINVELICLMVKIEEFEFWIGCIVVDGINCIGDFEFCLCELELICDIGILGVILILGGDFDMFVLMFVLVVIFGLQLVVGEIVDFEVVMVVFEGGEFQVVVDQFVSFV